MHMTLRWIIGRNIHIAYRLRGLVRRLLFTWESWPLFLGKWRSALHLIWQEPILRDYRIDQFLQFRWRTISSSVDKSRISFSSPWITSSFSFREDLQKIRVARCFETLHRSSPKEFRISFAHSNFLSAEFRCPVLRVFFFVSSEDIFEVSSLVDLTDTWDVLFFPLFFPLVISREQNFSPSKVFRISGFRLVRVRLEVTNVGEYLRSTQGSNMNILIFKLGTLFTNTTEARISFKDRSARSHNP